MQLLNRTTALSPTGSGQVSQAHPGLADGSAAGSEAVPQGQVPHRAAHSGGCGPVLLQGPECRRCPGPVQVPQHHWFWGIPHCKFSGTPTAAMLHNISHPPIPACPVSSLRLSTKCALKGTRWLYPYVLSEHFSSPKGSFRLYSESGHPSLDQLIMT